MYSMMGLDLTCASMSERMDSSSLVSLLRLCFFWGEKSSWEEEK